MRQLVAIDPYHRRDHRQCDGKPDIGRNDRRAFRRSVGIQFSAAQFFGRNPGQPAQDQTRSDARENRGAKAVERLRKGQAAMHRLLRPEQADQRIGDDLHHHNAARQNEQRGEEQAIGRGLAGRNEQQAAAHHGQQPDHRAAHVTHALDQLRAGNANQQVGGEEAELHQHRFGVAQCEQLLQLGQDHIVQRRDAAKDEEQRKDEIVEARSMHLAVVARAIPHGGRRAHTRCHCHCRSLP